MKNLGQQFLCNKNEIAYFMHSTTCSSFCFVFCVHFVRLLFLLALPLKDIQPKVLGFTSLVMWVAPKLS